MRASTRGHWARIADRCPRLSGEWRGATSAAPRQCALREIGGQGQLTLTLRGAAGEAGAVTQLGTQELEPLVCAVNKRPEKAGDGSKVDFLGPIKDGFRARPDLTVQPDQLAVWWEQTGNGRASIELRITQPKGQLRLVADYRCTDGDCVQEATSGTATREGAGAQLFFSPRGGSRVKVTAAIHGIPAGFTEVSYYLKTPQDNAPDPERSGADRAFIAVPVPAVCTAGQSNDDRWGVAL